MIEKILSKKVLLNVILFGVIFGGIMAYLGIGKLEDAEIQVRQAVIVTPYPGATAYEVELEVTDVLEKAIQKLENIESIKSSSFNGYSQITVEIEPVIASKRLPQIWDHLRRKINDVKSSLPSGASDPIVNDDFGDVYGIFVTVTGEGYKYKEFYNYVDLLRREFLEVEGVKRVEMFGDQTELIELVFSTEKFAELNINPFIIVQTLNDEGQVIDPGSVKSGIDRIDLRIGQKFSSIEDIANTIIQVPDGGSFRLGDIVEIKRSFYEPKSTGLTYDGERAISLALSMESGVNVITVGEKFDEKLAELKPLLPAGIEVHSVFSQPERVAYSIRGFIINLLESVVIVIVVLLFAMGIRSGLLIASGLLFTILATFIFMNGLGMELQRVSLAAIIVSMGMLVDNAIVIADGIIIDLKRGVKRERAFTSIVRKTALPLLGATVIAILAFLPLGLSPGAMGEYLGSLYRVLAISLLLSWVFAMIQTPYMASLFYKKRKPGSKKSANKDPFDNTFYHKFRDLIQWSLSHKILFIVTSLVILVASLASFKFVRFEFMPALDYNQFVIEYKLPKGSELTNVEKDLNEITSEIVKWDDIQGVTQSIGSTPARYTLLRPVSTGGSNYGELIIDVEDYETTLVVGEQIVKYIKEHYPQAETRKRVYGPVFTDYEIEAQFSGPDPDVLHDLANQAKAIMIDEPTAINVTDNWRNKVKVLVPEYSVEKARKLGISRSDVSNAMVIASEGMIVGVMQEGNTSLPIKLRLKNSIVDNVEKLPSIPVWGMYSKNSVPLAQLTDDVEIKWEDSEVFRYDGQRAILAQCDPAPGVLTSEVEKAIKSKIDAIELPMGYSLEWKGMSEGSNDAQGYLFANLPLALVLMLFIVIALFNNLKQAVIIFAIFPYAFVGIVFGFLSMGETFTFLGIIGALGLIGMMIKNSIVLLDEINQNIKEGIDSLNAIVNAAISRMRPVFMASATTILGMTPLLLDVMFKSLAITIIFGLLIGTVITLLVVPVMYAVIFKVDTSAFSKKNRKQLAYNENNEK